MLTNVAIPCCSGHCDTISKLCSPLLPPNCSLPTQFITSKSSMFLNFLKEESAAAAIQGKKLPSLTPTRAPKGKAIKSTATPTKRIRLSKEPTFKPSKIQKAKPTNAVRSIAPTVRQDSNSHS